MEKNLIFRPKVSFNSGQNLLPFWKFFLKTPMCGLSPFSLVAPTNQGFELLTDILNRHTYYWKHYISSAQVLNVVG